MVVNINKLTSVGYSITLIPYSEDDMEYYEYEYPYSVVLTHPHNDRMSVNAPSYESGLQTLVERICS